MPPLARGSLRASIALARASPSVLSRSTAIGGGLLLNIVLEMEIPAGDVVPEPRAGAAGQAGAQGNGR